MATFFQNYIVKYNASKGLLSLNHFLESAVTLKLFAQVLSSLTAMNGVSWLGCVTQQGEERSDYIHPISALISRLVPFYSVLYDNFRDEILSVQAL